MQPYLFPYLGYFNLIHACDAFVFYDDVNFIKQGWINRNRILVGGDAVTFTVPLADASSFRLIKDIQVVDLERFAVRFRKQIHQAYSKARNFELGMRFVDDVLGSGERSISRLAIRSIQRFCAIAGIDKEFMVSSESFSAFTGLSRADRLIQIAKALHADRYVNPIGGEGLYEKADFARQGIDLLFVRPGLPAYAQVGRKEFLPGLSVIDVLMHASPDEIRQQLAAYELV